MADRITTKPITVEDVEGWEAKHPAREIIRGEWAEDAKVAGQKHNLIGKRLFRLLDRFVMEHELGEVYTDGLNYVLDGTPGNITTMRIPDLSFVTSEKVDTDESGYLYFAPDLAVEVLSPSETAKIITDKIADYRKFGTKQVWVIDSSTQSITVHHADGRTNTYGKDQTLSGGDLLPEFEIAISELF